LSLLLKKKKKFTLSVDETLEKTSEPSETPRRTGTIQNYMIFYFEITAPSLKNIPTI